MVRYHLLQLCACAECFARGPPLLALTDAQLIALPTTLPPNAVRNHQEGSRNDVMMLCLQAATFPPSLLTFLSDASRLCVPRKATGVREVPLNDHWLKLNVSPKKKHEVER